MSSDLVANRVFIRSTSPIFFMKMKNVHLVSRSGINSLNTNQKQQDYFAFVKENLNSLNLRILRESLVATNRIDEFSIQVLEFSVSYLIKNNEFDLLNGCFQRLFYLYDQLNAPNLLFIDLYLLYCYSNSDNLQIVKIYRKYHKLGLLAYISCFSTLDFVTLFQTYTSESLNELEKLMIGFCFTKKRHHVYHMLQKSFFTLPVGVLKRFLLLQDKNTWDSFVEEFDIEIVDDAAVLKKRK